MNFLYASTESECTVTLTHFHSFALYSYIQKYISVILKEKTVL